MSPVRVSAVEYLNARPLVEGLERRTDLFDLRFDAPARCAHHLHDRSADLALIPSIEYLENADYRIVPDLAVASEGEVASVALFTTRPVTSLRSIAVDSNSRTAATLLRILCAEAWEIEPKLVKLRPDLPVMLKRCDAAMIIGDAPLFLDHEERGLEKVDLGEEWTVLTSLPFVWAAWVGRRGALTAEHGRALGGGPRPGRAGRRRHRGPALSRRRGAREVGRRYLRENVSFGLDERAQDGLRKFYEYAYEQRLVQVRRDVRFYDWPGE